MPSALLGWLCCRHYCECGAYVGNAIWLSISFIRSQTGHVVMEESALYLGIPKQGQMHIRRSHYY